MQSQVINMEVMNTIAQKLSESGFSDLEAVLDPMFLKANDHTAVRPETMKDFFLRDMKINISEKDFDLFIKSQPLLCSGYTIPKRDLLQLFDEPFRRALIKQVQSNSIMTQKRAQVETVMGVTKPVIQ